MHAWTTAALSTDVRSPASGISSSERLELEGEPFDGVAPQQRAGDGRGEDPLLVWCRRHLAERPLRHVGGACGRLDFPQLPAQGLHRRTGGDGGAVGEKSIQLVQPEVARDAAGVVDDAATRTMLAMLCCGPPRCQS
ncbi:hypothetical protein [Catenulispora pinisilvae]|uniref:hypothetical protein n=1 Tax=Catenulispora pinisilvae TaxID=2705253 RepID=UPI001891D8B8|nr:hypothetical protein [Catenulispora pinisilvae]